MRRGSPQHMSTTYTNAVHKISVYVVGYMLWITLICCGLHVTYVVGDMQRYPQHILRMLSTTYAPTTYVFDVLHNICTHNICLRCSPQYIHPQHNPWVFSTTYRCCYPQHMKCYPQHKNHTRIRLWGTGFFSIHMLWTTSYMLYGCPLQTYVVDNGFYVVDVCCGRHPCG